MIAYALLRGLLIGAAVLLMAALAWAMLPFVLAGLAIATVIAAIARATRQRRLRAKAFHLGADTATEAAERGGEDRTFIVTGETRALRGSFADGVRSVLPAAHVEIDHEEDAEPERTKA